jgi:hypothetical protein
MSICNIKSNLISACVGLAIFFVLLTCGCKSAVKPVTLAGNVAIKTAEVSGKVAAQGVKTTSKVAGEAGKTGIKTPVNSLKQVPKLLPASQSIKLFI